MTMSFGLFSLENPISTGRNRMDYVPTASLGKRFSPKRQRISKTLGGAPRFRIGQGTDAVVAVARSIKQKMEIFDGAWAMFQRHVKDPSNNSFAALRAVK
ncbi:hypothetical protein IVB36_18585 [Bradyrhizobium sp. 35]|uniref:hypothetical protein n=1 Tax=Bradyrhizobium sp. 35 TaxID=2782670 RepID=UPI001FF81B6A|nr:hypothetical protein [Bradyrhizobium sp. 35]MCK1452852.1 hypothetical protein [Bradyrhizobium sp. 35]